MKRELHRTKISQRVAAAIRKVLTDPKNSKAACREAGLSLTGKRGT